VTTAQNLAQVVVDNLFDGVNVEFYDTSSFSTDSGANWLIAFTTELRKLLPDAIIVHTSSVEHFNPSSSIANYIDVHEAVGDLIDFYNVRYYNEADPYTTYS
jgi:hypothetical protein